MRMNRVDKRTETATVAGFTGFGHGQCHAFGFAKSGSRCTAAHITIFQKFNEGNEVIDGGN